MAGRYLETYLTPAVLAAQKHYYGRAQAVASQPERDALTDQEAAFIQGRDSFYMATVTDTGWPYLQHRGGKPGFVRAVAPSQLLFCDYKGNRQLISTGNLNGNERVALFFMDYPRRERLKVLGYARVLDAREHPALCQECAETGTIAQVERLFLIEILSYDWNCPKYITPRFSAAEVEEVVEPLKHRIRELEEELRKGTSA